MITLTLLALLLVTAYCVTYLKERRARRLLKGTPSLSYLPFVGSMHHFIGGPEAVFRAMEQLAKMAEETNKPILIWAGPYPVLFLCDPDDVKIVTNTFVDKPYYYSFAKPWLGDGILTAPGSIWKSNIKKIVSAGSFNASTVESYQEKFSSQAAKLVAQLGAEAGKPFDMMDILATITLETVCQTALGGNFSSDSSFMETYYHSFNRVLALILERGFNNILYHLDFVYRLTPMYQELRRHVAVLHKVTNTVMSEDEKAKNSPDVLSSNVNGKPRAKYKSYLEYLLELQSRDPAFTPHQIQCEMHTIILAGQETVATALFYVLLVLGTSRELQEKLYQELKDIFGDSKRPVTKEDLDRMTYCEAVISETLRMYPPAPSYMRYADRDLKIKSCTIPKGTAVAIGVFGMGRSVRLWGPDAGQFRPERWFEPDCPGNTPAFAAFSYGRRACIGKKYAMAFLKTAVAQCVRELEFKSEADKMQFKCEVALRPINNYFIEIRRRE